VSNRYGNSRVLGEGSERTSKSAPDG